MTASAGLLIAQGASSDGPEGRPEGSAGNDVGRMVDTNVHSTRSHDRREHVVSRPKAAAITQERRCADRARGVTARKAARAWDTKGVWPLALMERTASLEKRFDHAVDDCGFEPEKERDARRPSSARSRPTARRPRKGMPQQAVVGRFGRCVEDAVGKPVVTKRIEPLVGALVERLDGRAG